MSTTLGPDRQFVAAKDHRCYFCDEICEKGKPYWRRSGADGDGIWTMKMHPECLEATAHWRDEDFETFTIGSMKRGVDEPR